MAVVSLSLHLLPDPPPQQSSQPPPIVPPVVPPLPLPVPEVLTAGQDLQPPPALPPLVPDAAVLTVLTPAVVTNICQGNIWGALQLGRSRLGG